MSCPRIPTWKRRLLIARRDKLEEQLEAIENAIDEGISDSNISSYEFDSGDGKQKTSYRNLNEVLKARETLELEYNRVLNRLCGKGIINLNLTRHRRSQGMNRF